MSDPRSPLGEALALREFWDLHGDPVLRGEGVPRGDGKLVILLPGLFANDIYLRTLRRWLGWIGYQVETSRLALNAGCADRLLDQVETSVRRRIDRHEGQIAVIGHSRGGMLGKALLTRLNYTSDGSTEVTHFVALGSPVGVALNKGKDGLVQMAQGTGQNSANSFVVDAGRRAMRFLDPDCTSPLCGCRYMDDLLEPLEPSVRTTTIFSVDDPIVAPSACPIEGANNIEVGGSHGGLVFNKEVYPHIAEALQ